MTPHPDLYALVLRLRAMQGELSSVPGQQPHALFLELVRQVDPELSNALHVDTLSKHFTVAALPKQQQRNILEMRVTLMQSKLFHPFTRALLQQSLRPAMCLGQTELVLEDVFGTPSSHAWSGFSSFTELVVQVQPTVELMLHFATPTAFTQGTMGQGNKKKFALVPLPETLFPSLAKRWNNLAPADFALDEELVRRACEDARISRYELKTACLSLRRNPQIGFVGHCSYQLPDDPVQQRVLCLLADAMFYLGVGMKTTHGMGMCRRER